MSQRESHIDGVLYSNILDTNLSKTSNIIKSYKKVETTPTTKTIVKTGSNPSKTAITQEKVKLKKDFGASIKSKILEAKEDNKEKYKIKPQPKQIRVVGERVTIIIQNKTQEKKRGELVDNFQYYESKNLSKDNKGSIVVHKRRGNPFYQSINSQGNQNYTNGESRLAPLEKKNNINTIETRTQRNQYQNKTYNTTKVTVTKTSQERGNRKRNNNESSYQRTINDDEEKRKKLKIINVEQKINQPVASTVQNNKKALDKAKNKINEDQSKFQQKKEEIQKTFISQEQKIIKEETGNFLCPNCGYELFGNLHKVGLEKWISRENNGIKKFIFYGKYNGSGKINEYYWFGKMEKIHHGSYTDSGSSCGVKRHIHIDSWTESVFKENDSIESCWKEAFTDKKWNENMGKLSCLFCRYKSNFIDFIRDKRRQAKQ